MQVFPFDIHKEEYDSVMKNLKVSDIGISIMRNRFGVKSYMITDISTPAANAIKQHVLALGGEAAVPAYSINCSEPKSSLVFSVREDRLPVLIDKFKCQCWKLPEVAEFIQKQRMSDAPWFMFQHEKFLTSRPLVMGILNVTPDSFSDGGKFLSFENAVARAKEMIMEGADIIDIGGESTRPGAEAVEECDEISRVVPIIKEIKSCFPESVVSIDTSKRKVAEKALDAGADLVNDISGLKFDRTMAELVGERKVPVVIMHISGTPENMQNCPFYGNIFVEMTEFLKKSIDKALSKGVAENTIIVDPGIGFGKNIEHNLSIIKHLEVFHSFSMPVLIGVSRKSMIEKITNRKVPADRLAATIALNFKALEKGAAIIRVHDIKEAKDAIAIHVAIKESKCF